MEDSPTAVPVVVSVITVSRNCLADLKLTVASVLAQTYPHIEFIVVDGLSSDGTAAYLASCGDALQWVSEADSGIADAFNKGLRMATGETLIFLNAGDVLVGPETIGEVFRAVPPAASIADAVIYGNFYSVSASEERLVVTDHHRLNRTNTINHQSAFTGRAVYKRFAYDQRLLLGMDYDYWLRCLAAGVPFIKVEVPVARFALTGRSSSLDYRLHNELIRYFLRALNSGQVLRGRDWLKLMAVGADAWSQVAIRRLIPARVWRWLKVLARRTP